MIRKKTIPLLFFITSLASCKSLKHLGSSDTTNNKKTIAQQRERNIKFIDGIEVLPGNVTGNISSKNKSVHINYAQPNIALNNFNIEHADWLQLKYAIVLDATVETLGNVSLLQTIDHWWGTKYCIGGSTEYCIDCSAFTQNLMRDVYGISVARTAQEQYDNSTRISVGNLQEGDLVFFKTTGHNISHVGVYLLNNKFVHAATSSGVMVSDLNDSYWQQRYKGAGRVIK